MIESCTTDDQKVEISRGDKVHTKSNGSKLNVTEIDLFIFYFPNPPNHYLFFSHLLNYVYRR